MFKACIKNLIVMMILIIMLNRKWNTDDWIKEKLFFSSWTKSPPNPGNAHLKISLFNAVLYQCCQCVCYLVSKQSWDDSESERVQGAQSWPAHSVSRRIAVKPDRQYRGRLQSLLHAESVESVLSVSRPGYREFIVRAWHYAVGLFVVGVQLGLQRVSAGVSVLFSQNQQVYCNPTRQPNNRQCLWACLVQTFLLSVKFKHKSSI